MKPVIPDYDWSIFGVRINICTLTSDSWSKDWNYTVSYNLRKLNTSYIGVFEKMNGIFG